MKQLVRHWTGNVPGYGDARWDGRWAISIPGKGLDTDTGLVACELPVCVRLPHHGPKIAIVGASSNVAREYDGARWHDKGKPYGTNAVIYDRDDNLVLATKAQGANGWRYVDAGGHLVSGDSTYADIRRGIFEYTEYEDIAIGQGSPEGVVVRFPGESFNRVLVFKELTATHNARNIRVSRQGQDFAITATCYAQHVTIVTWATLNELRRLPKEGTVIPTPPPPPPDPDPDPEPESEPEVTMRLPAEVKALRAKFIEKFPIPQQRDGEELGDFEERVRQWSIDLAEQCAFTFDGQGYGMKRASNGRPISKDTLARMYMGKLLIWDNLIGTGTGKPKLANDPDSQDASDQVFVRVTPTNHLGETKPPDPPPPPPPPPAQGYDDTALRKRISDLEAKFAEQSMALGNAQAALGVLQLKLANLRVKGGTSKVWGHAHDVDLKVEG